MKSHMFLDLFGNKSDDSIEFKQFIFKGGENYFKLVDADNVNYSHVTIRFTYHNDGSLFLLASAVDALRRLNRYIIIDLIIPYFPGARQDRVCVKGEAFSLQIYADFINNLNFNRVTVFDPHSDVTPALIKNVRVVNNHEFIVDCLEHAGLNRDNCVLVSPDAGSNKKIYKLSEYLGGFPVIRADKLRNVVNGEIIETIVYTDDLQGKSAFIVDDIISGGRTFMELALKLKEKNAKKIFLAVTHHEGHANVNKLSDSGISRVYSTNSLQPLVSDNFNTQFDYKKYV